MNYFLRSRSWMSSSPTTSLPTDLMSSILFSSGSLHQHGSTGKGWDRTGCWCCSQEWSPRSVRVWVGPRRRRKGRLWSNLSSSAYGKNKRNINLKHDIRNNTLSVYHFTFKDENLHIVLRMISREFETNAWIWTMLSWIFFWILQKINL